jgi:hypothetical protein
VRQHGRRLAAPGVVAQQAADVEHHVSCVVERGAQVVDLALDHRPRALALLEPLDRNLRVEDVLHPRTVDQAIDLRAERGCQRGDVVRHHVPRASEDSREICGAQSRAGSQLVLTPALRLAKSLDSTSKLFPGHEISYSGNFIIARGNSGARTKTRLRLESLGGNTLAAMVAAACPAAALHRGK